jgi:hypothetical protein
MKFWQAVCATAVVCACAANAEAAFHLWRIKEIFSSADGAAQFVEFFTTAGSERFLNSHNLIITSDGVPNEFVFNHDLPGSTASKHFLLATAGFGSLPGGVTPDYTLTTGSLFDPNAANITFNFAHNTDVATITGAQLPKDGVNSLTDTILQQVTPDTDNFVVGVNSPTNFAGAVGSVNVGGGGPAPGDFNDSGVVDGADLTLWRTNYGDATATFAQGDADDDDDVDGNDYLVWQRNIGAAAVPAVQSIPEPAAGVLALVTAIALLASARRAA